LKISQVKICLHFYITADAVINNISEMILPINFSVWWCRHWLNMTVNLWTM